MKVFFNNKIRAVLATALMLIMTIYSAGCGTAGTQQGETTQAQTTAVETAEQTQSETAAPAQPETETQAQTSRDTEAEEGNPVKGFIAIDPGHQSGNVDMSGQEPYAPGSSKTKAKATTGTSGTYSGIEEYELNMDIASMLRDELVSRGYEVLLLRESNDEAISNKERALKANESGADCTLRLHADGSEDSSANGASALIPSADNPWVGDLHDDSKDLAQDVLDSYCDATGIKNNGLSLRDDLTGTNWSEIPVALLEMGFMTNKSDDLNMADPDFRVKMVNGIADGIDKYFEDHPTKATGTAAYSDEVDADSKSEEVEKSASEVLAELDNASSSSGSGTVDAVLSDVNKDFIKSRTKKGEKWSVTMVDLFDESQADINGDQKMLSASVIKVFIMAAAYDRVLDPSSDSEAISMSSSEKTQLKSRIRKMITVSDNDAANSIVEELGGGSFAKGMKVVNKFCSDNGYSTTSLGRRFSGSNANGDNYTSANDCAALLKSIYDGSCVSRDASSEMLGYLQDQERTGKIPAGLQSFDGVTTANKTGELSGDTGIVENDIAIVWGKEVDYVLCILSSDLTDGNSSAIETIQGISKEVYEEFAE